MPTVGCTQYAYTPGSQFRGSDERRTQQAGSILLNIGRAGAVGDMVLLDIGGGIGYGFASESARIKNFNHSGDNFIGSFTVSIGFRPGRTSRKSQNPGLMTGVLYVMLALLFLFKSEVIPAKAACLSGEAGISH